MSAIEVTDDLVRNVARLARLALSDDDLPKFQEHFRKILAYVSELQALDTGAVDATHFAAETFNVFREDEPRASLAVSDALRNAPQSSGSFFVVPRIVGGPDADLDGGEP